jgi:hypothetical protein
MRENYSVPFRMAFLEGGVKSYMAALQCMERRGPSCDPVLNDVVSKEWVPTDCHSDAGAIGYAVDQHNFFDMHR